MSTQKTLDLAERILRKVAEPFPFTLDPNDEWDVEYPPEVKWWKIWKKRQKGLTVGPTYGPPVFTGLSEDYADYLKAMNPSVLLLFADYIAEADTSNEFALNIAEAITGKEHCAPLEEE